VELIHQGKTMNIQISFPPIEAPDENDGVRFPVVINQNRAGCKITTEALQDKFGMRDNDSMKTFKAHRQTIENLIREMILGDPTGRIYEIATNQNTVIK
jgi:hypothetical protein